MLNQAKSCVDDVHRVTQLLAVSFATAFLLLPGASTPGFIKAHWTHSTVIPVLSPICCLTVAGHDH